MRFSIPLLVAFTAVLAGCQTGEVKAILPLADGTQIAMPITQAGPPRGEGGGYQVQQAMLLPPNPDHMLAYGFSLLAKKAPDLKRIQIDDVTDETIEPLLDDKAPKFDKQIWHGMTDLMAPDDARLKWIYQITGSMRVYRFTLTPASGAKISFYHVSPYPPFIKAAVRSAMGEKY